MNLYVETLSFSAPLFCWGEIMFIVADLHYRSLLSLWAISPTPKPLNIISINSVESMLILLFMADLFRVSDL